MTSGLFGAEEPRRTVINLAFVTAYRNGRQAFRQGALRKPPYTGGGWGDNYRHYWRVGWDDAQTGREERYTAK